tara:strand:- start:8942 stop:9196 length:255 start_codon:yes stop_codon:yes gene_type:complete
VTDAQDYPVWRKKNTQIASDCFACPVLIPTVLTFSFVDLPMFRAIPPELSRHGSVILLIRQKMEDFLWPKVNTRKPGILTNMNA